MLIGMESVEYTMMRDGVSAKEQDDKVMVYDLSELIVEANDLWKDHLKNWDRRQDSGFIKINESLIQTW